MDDLGKRDVREVIEVLKGRVRAAKGDVPSDLVLRNGKLVNVFTGEILERDIAVYDGTVVGLGPGYEGRKEVDLGGRWVVPGLIDGHIHIESTMLLPSRLAAALLVHGTTTIVSDPHEIANVLGLEGVKWMLEDSEGIPFDTFFMAPSCVPATSLETGGATLGASDLSILREEPRVLGLAEVMNFPGVLAGDENLMEKVAGFSKELIDGHCPALRGRGLQAYLAVGIRSDHETSDPVEALEKIQSGMMVMIREGSTARNLEALLPLVNQKNVGRFMLVSDDLDPLHLSRRGHLDFVIRKSIRLGLDPIAAIRMATSNPAQYFGLKDRGVVAPGYLADMVVLDELERFEVAEVYKNGSMVSDHGEVLNFPVKEGRIVRQQPRLFNIGPLSVESFKIAYPGGKARVMELIPGQIITRTRFEEVKIADGGVSSDIDADVLKLSVVERHKASGRVGMGLVKGFGLKKGAMASSVAHDSHNVIAVGVKDQDLYRVVEEVSRMGGGLAVVRDEMVLARMPLGVAGLMSEEPLHVVVKQLKKVKEAAASLGCRLEEPFMALSFLALPVIPDLKLTDRGLVDVNRFEFVPLFLNKDEIMAQGSKN